jgi:hypothetical protein
MVMCKLEEKFMNKWMGLTVIILGIFFGYFLVRDINSDKEMTKKNEETTFNKEHWYKYISPKGNFSILFPNMPHSAHELKREEKNQEKREHELFVATKENGTLFSVYLITFPEKKTLEDKSEFLIEFIKEMLNSNPQNVIKAIKVEPYRNMNAVDFTVEVEEATIDGKAFVKGNTAYVLSTTAKNENTNKAEFDFFTNSFAWLKEAQTHQKK